MLPHHQRDQVPLLFRRCMYIRNHPQYKCRLCNRLQYMWVLLLRLCMSDLLQKQHRRYMYHRKSMYKLCNHLQYMWVVLLLLRSYDRELQLLLFRNDRKQSNLFSFHHLRYKLLLLLLPSCPLCDREQKQHRQRMYRHKSMYKLCNRLQYMSEVLLLLRSYDRVLQLPLFRSGRKQSNLFSFHHLQYKLLLLLLPSCPLCGRVQVQYRQRMYHHKHKCRLCNRLQYM